MKLLATAPAICLAPPEKAPPKRRIFLNVGSGISEQWFSEVTGDKLILNDALQAIAYHRDNFSVLSNLTNLNSSSRGSHWGSTTFLTSIDVSRTLGRAFHNGVSCDQAAATHLGQDARYPSLALAAPDGNDKGHGSGASLSWDKFGNPIEGETNQL